MFNIDLLHPLEGKADLDLMVDHLDLHVRECAEREATLIVKSIALPESAFVFRGHIVQECVTGTLPAGGSQLTLQVPLIDEVGVVVTKCECAKRPKRPRDAFDIYLALVQAVDPAAVLSGIAKLRRESQLVNASLVDFETFAAEPTFDKNVGRFAAEAGYSVAAPGELVLSLLQKTSPPVAPT
ncbi:MAG: hypothetical protein NT029_10565 [Armatimonadetes bacterium]|nr:hypothetical protein [Armatimonadota bacterium]